MKILDIAKKVLKIEADAIEKAIGRLNGDFEKAVQLFLQAKGRIVVTGMGKSGLIGKKIAATLTSTGSPAAFLHPSEALHGDIGIIHNDDTVLALSTSGETGEVLRLLSFIKRIGVPLISLVGQPESTLARESDVFIDCSIETEACPIGLVPSTSTTLTLAIGDAIAIALMQSKGFSENDFHYFHPAGAIGKKLLKVHHLMHQGKDLPVVMAKTLMMDVIRVINDKRFGVAIVLDKQEQVAGVITDGDLRRQFLKGTNFGQTRAADCMTAQPLRIDENQMAVQALQLMEQHHVTALVVTDQERRLRGLLHLHDLWRTEMI